MDEQLDITFQQAYQRAANTDMDIAPDVKLRIYAYYKQATYGGRHQFKSEEEHTLVRAFKFNAWQQVQHLTKTEAKKAYIDLVNQLGL
ncbi:MAG TPA: acyl-CoA-binding protein [Flavobacterium sp.]|nr:acyl-CoA-binding protein [Flavobacterium sp.]